MMKLRWNDSRKSYTWPNEKNKNNAVELTIDALLHVRKTGRESKKTTALSTMAIIVKNSALMGESSPKFCAHKEKTGNSENKNGCKIIFYFF
ncbi:MAG: hypothetical protein AAB727_02190, partial [Patescibacteria group bacterium]